MSPASVSIPEEKSTTRAPERPTMSADFGAADVDSGPPVTVIEGQRPWWPLVDFHELWQHREMLYSLTMHEVMRRYKQTVLGAVWAVLPVVGNTALVAFFLGPLLRTSIDNMPISLFIFTGLLPWYLLVNVMNSSANSVMQHTDLVSRIYFPRLILPLSGVGDRLIDFLIGLLILGVALFFFPGYMPGSDLVILPVVILGLVMAGLGVGLFVAAAGVLYRDAFHALALLAQFWFFATPSIFYSKSIIPESLSWLHGLLPLNPAFGLIENFRGAMTGRGADFPALFISLGVSVVLLLGGVAYFQRTERKFADEI